MLVTDRHRLRKAVAVRQGRKTRWRRNGRRLDPGRSGIYFGWTCTARERLLRSSRLRLFVLASASIAGDPQPKKGQLPFPIAGRSQGYPVHSIDSSYDCQQYDQAGSLEKSQQCSPGKGQAHNAAPERNRACRCSIKRRRPIIPVWSGDFTFGSPAGPWLGRLSAIWRSR